MAGQQTVFNVRWLQLYITTIKSIKRLCHGHVIRCHYYVHFSLTLIKKEKEVNTAIAFALSAF